MAEAIKENGREEPGPNWASREAKPHLTSEFPNMDLIMDIVSDTSISLGDSTVCSILLIWVQLILLNLLVK